MWPFKKKEEEKDTHVSLDAILCYRIQSNPAYFAVEDKKLNGIPVKIVRDVISGYSFQLRGWPDSYCVVGEGLKDDAFIGAFVFNLISECKKAMFKAEESCVIRRIYQDEYNLLKGKL